MDIAVWLRDLGLERYAQAFLDNDIDASVLAELSDSNLADMIPRNSDSPERPPTNAAPGHNRPVELDIQLHGP